MAYTVTIRRNADGLTRDYVEPYAWNDDDDETLFYWTDGNCACDCVRANMFADAAGEPRPEVPCSSELFTVVRFTLEDGRIVDPQED